MKSKISIILPAKNAAPFIYETLESIINQSYENWECICVNDNSEDATRSIIEEVSLKDSRIKVIDSNGKGVIAALKEGYAETSGELISRMDADDVMPVDKLETLEEVLSVSGMNTVATGKVKYFNALGDGFLKYEQWLNGLIEAKSHWNHIYKECVIASPNWLIHRKDFDRIGAFNSDTYPEDYELVFRWYEAGIKVVSSSKVTHLWRDHEDRASRTLDIYADNTFLPLKIRFYKRIDWDVDKTVVLWGAGKKGKAVAKALQRENIPFKWLTNNVNKIGRDIYGVVLESADKHGFGSDQVLIAISSPEEQKDVCEQLENLEMRLGSQYYIFV